MYQLRLQRLLDEANGRYRQDDKIRTYTASVRRQKDIENLTSGKIGLSTHETAEVLDLPISFVKRQMIRIAQNNEARNRFLRTGVIPVSDPGVFSILQK
jgi:hypothetical protein